MLTNPDDEAAWEGLLTWNYRIMRTADAAGVSYAIYEVYDDADGRPHSRTVDPAHPAGETLAELREDLQHYLAALDQPVLEDAVFDGAT